VGRRWPELLRKRKRRQPMASLNTVLLIGNLTKDPEVRYTPSGKAVGDLRLAVNRTYRAADGADRDETCFIDIVVWGRQAETCGEYLRKGSAVLVDGRLQYNEWEKDGRKHSRIRVVAQRVQFLGSPRRSGGESNDGAARAPRQEPETPGNLDMPGANEVADDDNVPF
jgi:single-strand DNA-binding protein